MDRSNVLHYSKVLFLSFWSATGLNRQLVYGGVSLPLVMMDGGILKIDLPHVFISIWEKMA